MITNIKGLNLLDIIKLGEDGQLKELTIDQWSYIAHLINSNGELFFNQGIREGVKSCYKEGGF